MKIDNYHNTPSRKRRRMVEELYAKGPRVRLRLPTNADLEMFNSWMRELQTNEYLNIEEPLIPENEAGIFAERLRSLPAKLHLFHELEQLRVKKGPGMLLTKEELRMLREIQHLRSEHQILPQDFRNVDLMFAIENRRRKTVGMIKVNVSIVHQIATIRTIVGPEFRGYHYGREAKLLILEYLFEHLGLEKVCSRMAETNIANYRCNLASGFKVDARLKEHAFIEHRRCDLICMAVWRRDWPNIKKRLRCPRGS